MGCHGAGTIVWVATLPPDGLDGFFLRDWKTIPPWRSLAGASRTRAPTRRVALKFTFIVFEILAHLDYGFFRGTPKFRQLFFGGVQL